MRLSDSVIAEVSRLLQVAILTGTDVVDNLRLIEVEQDEENNMVVLTSSYVERAERNIETMLERASELGTNNG